jgi:hypothetical protein
VSDCAGFWHKWLSDRGERQEQRMNLRLISSSDGRAVAIRDHLLPLLRQHGALEVQRDMVRLIELRMARWTIRHWTPFNELDAGEASSPGYRHAIERQRRQPDLPYGLEVWRRTRVLRVLWADDGTVEVVIFVRGSWEDEALAL